MYQYHEELAELELTPGASLDEVKRAYRDLSKVWHPDRFQHDERLQRRAIEHSKRINAAYATLVKALSGRSSSSETETDVDARSDAPETRHPAAISQLRVSTRTFRLSACVVATIVVLLIVLLAAPSRPQYRTITTSSPQQTDVIYTNRAQIVLDETRSEPKLFVAVRSCNVAAIERAIDSSVIGVNAQDPVGQTALTWAVRNRCYLGVEALLSRGANPDIQANNGLSAREWAIKLRDDSILRMFQSQHSYTRM